MCEGSCVSLLEIVSLEERSDFILGLGLAYNQGSSGLIVDLSSWFFEDWLTSARVAGDGGHYHRHARHARPRSHCTTHAGASTGSPGHITASGICMHMHIHAGGEARDLQAATRSSNQAGGLDVLPDRKWWKVGPSYLAAPSVPPASENISATASALRAGPGSADIDCVRLCMC